MKMAAICCTYKRPRELANAIACFETQDYPDRELIVLDDAGQYGSQSGDRWRIVSLPARFRTLGEKRNASAALASADADAYCVWDDDDAYLPWHMSAAAAAIRSGADYSIPTRLYIEKPGPRLELKENTYLFHGAWAFTRRAFTRVCGYPFMQSGQDQELLRRFKWAKLACADPIRFDARPSYVYRWFTSHRQHLSVLGPDGYEQLGKLDAPKIAQITPAAERDWIRLASETAEPAKQKTQYYFIHLPKCGGSYLTERMSAKNQEMGGTTYVSNGHCGVSRIDAARMKSGGAVIVGNIRHPYDVYKSLWTFGCSKSGGLYQYIRDQQKRFAGLYDSYRNVGNFRTWLRLILEYELALPRVKYFQDTLVMQKHNIGLLTYRFFSLYNDENFGLLDDVDSNPIVDRFVRLENLKHDLALIGLDYAEGKVNSSSGSLSTEEYYDAALKKLVYEKDAYIFRKFGYER